MKLPSTIRFIDKQVKETLCKLETGDDADRELSKNINAALDVIEKDAFCGIQIPKRLIPKEYIKKYDLKNLWKYNLPKGWRLLYSVMSDRTVVISLILD
jgi:Txe/YoeB family toxin of Txe-Axe toxin-antitoxin module